MTMTNLLPPVDAVRVRSLEIVEASSASGFVVVHPRYRHWLAKCGLTMAADFLGRRGEIVSGHHDRHVMRIELPAGGAKRIVYLKREHRVSGKVRRRNARAGFGPVSRSVREAKVLERLEAMGLATPQWIAYGECEGRAFLLVDELAGLTELRTLAKVEQTALIRREIAVKMGESLADLHVRKIRTPDLSAKHVFLRTDSGTVTLIDWAGAEFDEVVTFEDRVAALAQLDASLAESLATPRERVRMLRSYLKNLKGLPPLGEWVTRIQRLKRRLAKRSSIRDQRAGCAAKQTLLWLADDEAVCVTPGMAECWPQPAISAPYYLRSTEVIENGRAMEIVAPDGEPATLIRWRSWNPLGRCLATLRGKCWRSPATVLAKRLFREERRGGSDAKLLAFGQRVTGRWSAESFVLLRKGGA